MQNKILIRKELRTKRHAISTDERDSAAFAAAKLLTKHVLFQKSQHIAAYLARDDEFETKPIIEAIWHAEKSCYLPSLLSEKERKLDFVLYHINDSLRLNRFQILESENKTVFASTGLDLVLMPLVGFDLVGHRLGLGGGYYDKTFSFVLENPIKKPFLLGLAYEEQCVAQLPHDQWDVPLDGILTEKRLIVF